MIILSDLSEVLIRGVYGVNQLIEESYGARVAEQFQEHCDQMHPFFLEWMRGHINEREYWSIFFREDIWPFGAEEVKSLISMNFAEGLPNAIDVYERIIEYPDMICVNSARSQGRPDIWIVSDHFIERRYELEAIHPEVFRLASKLHWSYDFGLVKQDPGFFHQLLYQNGLHSEDVIFIDDLTDNIWAAERAGITSIQFDSPKQLEKDLRYYGFRFARAKNHNTSK